MTRPVCFVCRNGDEGKAVGGRDREAGLGFLFIQTAILDVNNDLHSLPFVNMGVMKVIPMLYTM